jgi:hypothetical protein
MHGKVPRRSISKSLKSHQLKSPSMPVPALQKKTINTVKPTKEPMTRKDHVDQPIEFILQTAYSANKALKWRRKQVGLVASDVQVERFRQCILSGYLLLKAYFQVTKMQTHTDAPNQQRGNDGQRASQFQCNTLHSIAYLCKVSWEVSSNLLRTLQPWSYGIMTKAVPKPITGLKKIKGLSVINDRAHALAMCTAMSLFTLDYLKGTKLS